MDQSSAITLLFDFFSMESRNLYESFKNAGVSFTAAVIEDDGFLPDDVVSVYGYFCADGSLREEKPRYFNQIDIPDYWRIEGSNSNARVMDKTKERARIFYTEPKNRRLVKTVDWLDDKGAVRISEHYNKQGQIFCRTLFNKRGEKVLRRFYSPKGQERVVENFVTGGIIVNWQGKDKILHSRTELVRFYLECAGLLNSRVYFNSLSYPFFVSQMLPDNGKEDILFWNEPVGSEIPGNMQIILGQQAARTAKIYVQRRASYDRLIELGASPDIVEPLGYVYSFIRENNHNPEVLICTNSDRVAHINEIAQQVPSMKFHIAAITEMSSKLMAAGANDNVFLYPNVKKNVLDSLFDRCDIYLDINYEGEIEDAVHRAFLNNQLIIAFEETMHNAYYTADTNTFGVDEYKELAEALNTALKLPELIDQALEMQHNAALSAEAQAYNAFQH